MATGFFHKISLPGMKNDAGVADRLMPWRAFGAIDAKKRWLLIAALAAGAFYLLMLFMASYPKYTPVEHQPFVDMSKPVAPEEGQQVKELAGPAEQAQQISGQEGAMTPAKAAEQAQAAPVMMAAPQASGPHAQDSPANAGSRRETAFSHATPKKAPAAGPETDDMKEEKILNLLFSASSFENEGETGKAINAYRKVLLLDPANYRVMNNMAAHYIKLGLVEDARILIDGALTEKQDYAPAVLNKAILSAIAGDEAGAIHWFEKAEYYEPMDRAVLHNIASFHEGRGAYDQARDYYEKLKAVDYGLGSEGAARVEQLAAQASAP